MANCQFGTSLTMARQAASLPVARHANTLNKNGLLPQLVQSTLMLPFKRAFCQQIYCNPAIVSHVISTCPLPLGVSLIRWEKRTHFVNLLVILCCSSIMPLFILHPYQANLTFAESIWSKYALESHFCIYGIKHHHYASHSHPFMSKEWIASCANQ